jgi:hypothetical protein
MKAATISILGLLVFLAGCAHSPMGHPIQQVLVGDATITIPAGVRMTEEEPVDFLVYRFYLGTQNIASVYAGGHPSFPFGNTSATHTSTVNTEDAQRLVYWNKGKFIGREMLLYTGGYWQYHAWTNPEAGEAAALGDEIIMSIRVKKMDPKERRRRELKDAELLEEILKAVGRDQKTSQKK